MTGWVFPWLATAFNAANYLVLSALLELVALLAALPFAAVEVSRPGALFFGLVIVLSLLGPLLPQSQQARKAAIFVLLIGANIAVWSHVFRSRDLEIFFLYVGQGDAPFCVSPMAGPWLSMEENAVSVLTMALECYCLFCAISVLDGSMWWWYRIRTTTILAA